jgi:hypothetical protein
MTSVFKPPIAISLIIVLVLIGGCVSDKYFRTELDPEFVPESIDTVGVFVFSNGPTIHGSVSAFYYPEEVTRSTTLFPDTTNTGPSLELAREIVKQLEARGYVAVMVEEMGHRNWVSVDQCIEHARNRGYGAAFVASYTGFDKIGRTPAYVYVTNAALFTVEPSKRVWSNCYYGLVQNSHTRSLSLQSGSLMIYEAWKHVSGMTYVETAPKAAEALFAPQLWPASFTPLPARTRSPRGRKM